MLNRFDLKVQSEERSPVTSEQEYDEVMQAMATDEGWPGYEEWSEHLEQLAFEQEQERRGTISTERGLMFLNRDCAHKECASTRCSKGASYAGIAI